MPLQAKKPSQFTVTMLGYSLLSCQTAFFNDTICFNFLAFKPQKIETIYFVEQVRLSSFNTPKKQNHFQFYLVRSSFCSGA